MTSAIKGVEDPNSRKVESSSTKIISAKTQRKIEERNKERLGNTYSALVTQLKGSGQLWEDPEFPAGPTSLGKNIERKRTLEWKRPKEITKCPKLFVGGADRFDVKQGELGDCWLLAVIATLSMHEPLFFNVVPVDQDFEENYIGAFRFRFWRFGTWTEIIVDDRLPTYKNRLVFMHSAESDEFWSALLEKAYAKLCGSYDALSGGSQLEAMEDFTGGLCETIRLNEKDRPKDLFNLMIDYAMQSSLMGSAIESKTKEAALTNGLIMGHAYSVTGLERAELQSGESVDMIRLRNPWGNDKEWLGPWSDNSQEWNTVIEEDLKRIQSISNFKNDGEFWISFEDFVANFTKLEVCHLGPESLDESIGETKRWEMSLESGSWIKNVNAGGSKKYFDSFIMNPQYRVQIIDPDESDADNNGTVIVGLMQKDTRIKNLTFSTIGYAIYSLKDPNCGILDKAFLKFGKTVAISPFTNKREVSTKHKLPPGHYVIIPSTFEPNEEAEFILRIFTQMPSKTGELDVKNDRVKIADHLDLKENDQEIAKLEKELEELFKKAAGTKDVINATQLKSIVNKVIGRELKSFVDFDFEVCRSMIALFDDNCTGRMEYPEYQDLFKNLMIWKKAFKEFDVDNSGTFNAFEFRNALNMCGLSVSNALFKVLANRYSEPEEGVISFTDFIMSVIRLTNAFETMKEQPSDEQKRLLFYPEEFIQNLLYM